MPALRPRIDPGLRALIPPLSAPEREQLETSLVAEGCRDALVVWKGRDILLDGHHRLGICECLGLPYCTVDIDLADEDAAREWVVRNQFARRNLTPFQRAELALLLEPAIAARAKEKQRQAGGPLPQKSAEPPLDTREELARVAGVSHDTISKAKVVIERGDDDMKAALRTGSISLHQAHQRLKRAAGEARREASRQENRERIAAAPTVADAVAEATFATIVADPPWAYRSDPYGRSQPEYATMSVEEFSALPVGERADEDAHLYLWTTNSHLRPAFEVLEAWGFTCVTILTWCKPRFGMGSYFRGQTEHVLFGVRGNQPLKRKDVGTWFKAPVAKHSEKPTEFYDLVESCSPGPYLELFARQPREGWITWGGEL